MAKRKKQQISLFTIVSIILVIVAAFAITYYTTNKSSSKTTFSNVSSIPQDVLNSLSAPSESEASDSNQYKVLNNNTPYFTKDDLYTKSYESYSDLDSLKRVGQANAIIGTDLMPNEKRSEISHVRPSGWQSNKGTHVYDRSHLIAFQLAGENDNEKKTNKHVRYRVTPVFKDKDLVAQGVIMEAMSVEDNGASVKYNVFIYNYQKGVIIDYKTGKYTVK